MDLLHAAHFAAVCDWFGIKHAAVIVEVLGRGATTRYAAARMHLAIHLFIEAPLLGAIVVSGVALFRRLPEPGGLVWAQMIAGGIAVALNVLASRSLVHRGFKVALGDDMDLLRHGKETRWILGLNVAAVPFVLLAGLLGGRGAGWW